MKLHRWAILALAGALSLGCGDGSTGPESIAGIYELQSINGDVPPITLFEQTNYKLEITGGALTLNSNGSFVDRIDLRETDNGTVDESSAEAFGTFDREGNTVTFEYEGGETATATLSGTTLTQDFEGDIYVYRR